MSKPDKDFFLRILDLFKKYGIKSVTMEDVSRELGISKKTLYVWVKDKKDLVKKTMEYEHKITLKYFNEIENQQLNAIDELFEVHKFIKTYLSEHSSSLEYDLKKYYPELFKELQSRKRMEMYNSVYKNIIKGKEEKMFRDELNAELISKIYVGRILNTHDSEFFSIHDFISEQAFSEYMIYHIRGLANQNGLKYLDKKISKM